jgi:hypothetical protein
MRLQPIRKVADTGAGARPGLPRPIVHGVEDALKLVDATTLRVLRRLRVVAALLGSGVSLAVVTTTLLPGGPWVPNWQVQVLFVLVFPVFGSTVIERYVEERHRLAGKPLIGRWRYRLPGRDSKWPPEQIAGAPFRVAAAVGVLSTVLWSLALSGIVLSKGQPHLISGHYFAASHGDLTVLTKAGYNYQVALMQRTFVSVSAVFMLVATVLSWRDLMEWRGQPSRGCPR